MVKMGDKSKKGYNINRELIKSKAQACGLSRPIIFLLDKAIIRCATDREEYLDAKYDEGGDEEILLIRKGEYGNKRQEQGNRKGDPEKNSKEALRKGWIRTNN